MRQEGPLHASLGEDEEKALAAMREAEEDSEPSKAVMGRPQIPIDLVELEDLLADPDLTMAQVSSKLGLGRNTIYTRKDADPAFAKVYERGLARREEACAARRKPASALNNGRRARSRQEPGNELARIGQDSGQEVGQPPTEESVALDRRRDTQEDGHHRVKIEYGSVTIFCDTPEEAVALADLLRPTSLPLAPEPRMLPKTVKQAWSKDFENDDGSPEGWIGMSYLYLVSMLHDGMEEGEKEAVWILLRYLKRMEAAKELAKEQSTWATK